MLFLNLQGSVPALRWRNDKRLFAPMSTTPCGNVLTGEFVQFTQCHLLAMSHNSLVRYVLVHSGNKSIS